jgi:hypothetical protein
MNGNAILPLTLFVFGVGTDHHDLAATTDDATLFTHFFDGRSNFHAYYSGNTASSLLYQKSLTPVTYIEQNNL